MQRMEKNSQTEESRCFLKRSDNSSSVIAPEGVQMVLTKGSSYFFVHCLRKVKQNQRSFETAPHTQKQANTETSFLSLCGATYFTCLQTLQHVFVFAFLFIPISLVQVHFREVSTCLSQQLSP